MDAKKDYSHVISGYRNELRLNGKATLSAYCRSVGVSISAVHHWMENYGPSDHIQESAIFTVIYYLLHLHFI